MTYYGNNDYRDYLAHHGVLGMHWGIRRYQPYSVKPRGSGKGGKFVGKKQTTLETKGGRYDRDLAKKETMAKAAAFANDQARLYKNDALKYRKREATELAAYTEKYQHGKTRESREKWLTDMYGPDDWKNAKYMKDVFEVDDVHKHAREEIQKQEEEIKDYNSAMAQVCEQESSTWIKKREQFTKDLQNKVSRKNYKFAKKILANKEAKEFLAKPSSKELYEKYLEEDET